MATKGSVLITGCSSGIGHALALEFKANGYRVFATARKASALSDLESKGIEPLSLEVTDGASIQALHAEVAARTGGKLHYLINNAGRNYTMPALDMELDEVRDMFEINVFAVMRMVQTFAPLVIAARGTVVQLDSLACHMPYVFGATYGASKGAMFAYMNTLRIELAPFGVRVVNLITGGVATKIGRHVRKLPPGSIYLPIEEEFMRRQSYHNDVAMKVEDYVRRVVKTLTEQPKKDEIWEGGGAFSIWFANAFLPRYMLDDWFRKEFKLDRLKESAPGAKKVA